jgi:SAM-dependent methyltransferase
VEFDATERTVLIASWEVRRRAETLRDREGICAAAREVADGAAESPDFDARIDAAIDRMIKQGCLVADPVTGEFSLAPSGLERAAALHSEDARRGFGEWMVRSEKSAAYARYCERTYGMPLIQFNMIDSVQMEALLSAIAVRPGERIVDLGCGIGTTTEFIARRTGGEMTGIDFAEGAIERAQERTRERGLAITFRIGDLNKLKLPRASFNVALALDTLYFAHDLQRTVGDIVESLAQGGKFAAFYSAARREGDADDVLKAESTRLAQALVSEGCVFSTWDFTDRDRAYWQACRDATDEMRAEFVAEDNAVLWSSRDDETRRIQKRYEEGTMRRYLYLATAPSS